MATQLTRNDVRVLDPDTYGNGDPTTFGLPLDQYAYLREHEPVSLHTFEDDPLLLDRLYVISRNEDISNIDRDEETWSAEDVVNFWAFAPIGKKVDAPALLTQDQKEHADNRKIVSRAFTPKNVKNLEESFRRLAVEVVEAALAKKEPINFVQEIAHVMPMEALGQVLGVPKEDRPKFFGWVDTFASPFDPRVSVSFEKVGEAIQALYQYGIELAELRRKEPGENVMTKIAEADMPDPEVRGNITLLASGAAESTRTALSHGLHELMRNPEQMAWLRERADDIPSTAIQEMVRIASPFTHLCRSAKKDTVLHDVEIKQGDVVAMLFAAGNFDPEAFDDPNTFDLSRDPNPHLSFGRGPHSCLGKHVAALEMKILMEELLQRTEDIRPAGDISYVRDAYSRGVYELPVELIPA
jgi:cholest-4-en-3-one 26-monooxygenase